MSGARGVLAVAMLEFQQAMWSLRSLALGAVFVLFVAAGAFLGLGALLGAPGAGAGGIPQGVAGSLVLLAVVAMTAFFAPLLAMFSSVDTIVGERATRTIDMLLSRPVTRRGLALGKLLGRAAHLALIALVAMVVGLVVIASQAAPQFADVLAIAALTAVLCAAWASLALLLSSLARTPTSALVGGFVVWLVFYPFWGFVQAGFDRIGMGGLPPLVNPNTLYLGAVAQSVPATRLVLERLTEGLASGIATVGLVGFVLVAAAVAIEVFGRQDEAGAS